MTAWPEETAGWREREIAPWEEQVGAKEGNQSGGQTVTLLVLPLNGFWLGFERQRLEASPIEELEQVLSMEKVLPPSRRDTAIGIL